MPTRTLIAIATTLALAACAAPSPVVPAAGGQSVATEPGAAPSVAAPVATAPNAAVRELIFTAAIDEVPLANAGCRAYPLGAPDQAVRLTLDAGGQGRLAVPETWAAGTPIVIVASGEAGTAAVTAVAPEAPSALRVLAAGDKHLILTVAHGLAYALLRPRLDAVAHVARTPAGAYDAAPVEASLEALKTLSAALKVALTAAPAATRQAAARALDASGAGAPDAATVSALVAANPALANVFDAAARALAAAIQSAVAAGAQPPDPRLTGPLSFGSFVSAAVSSSSSGNRGGGTVTSPTPAAVILEGQAQ